MTNSRLANLVAGAVLAVSACSTEQNSPNGTPTAAPPQNASAPGAGANASASSVPSQPTEAGTIETSPPKPTRVPMFMAQGKLGRRTVSCDDGRTWIANHDEDPDAHCWDETWPKNIECDHDKWSSVGMVEANGYFLATYGWGYPGVVQRTEDGIHWEDVFAGSTFAGMAFGNGKVVANGRPSLISGVDGALGSWTPGGDLVSSVWNVRRIGFLPDGAGRFVVSLESGAAADIIISDDNATTWRVAAGRPAECARSVAGIVSNGKGVALMAQTNGTVCRSTDAGENWTHVPVTDSFSSNPLVVDGGFMIWKGSTRYRSADGLTWTSAEGTAGVGVGPVARGASGTYVTVVGAWGAANYDKQQFVRSVDGLVWESLPTSAFVQSHPITHLIFGWAKPSAACPLP